MNELAGKNYSPVGSGKACLPYGLPAGWADHPILLGGSRDLGSLENPLPGTLMGVQAGEQDLPNLMKRLGLKINDPPGKKPYAML